MESTHQRVCFPEKHLCLWITSGCRYLWKLPDGRISPFTLMSGTASQSGDFRPLCRSYGVVCRRQNLITGVEGHDQAPLVTTESDGMWYVLLGCSRGVVAVYARAVGFYGMGEAEEKNAQPVIGACQWKT
jgi:hypothetical protein